MLRTDVHVKFARSATSSTAVTMRVRCMFMDTACNIMCRVCNKIRLQKQSFLLWGFRFFFEFIVVKSHLGSHVNGFFSESWQNQNSTADWIVGAKTPALLACYNLFANQAITVLAFTTYSWLSISTINAFILYLNDAFHAQHVGVIHIQPEVTLYLSLWWLFKNVRAAWVTKHNFNHLGTSSISS